MEAFVTLAIRSKFYCSSCSKIHLRQTFGTFHNHSKFFACTGERDGRPCGGQKIMGT